MSRDNGEYHGPMPPGVKPIKRRAKESLQAFNLRKARIRRKAFEAQRAAREAAYAKEHPSDEPLEKFARVWDEKFNKEFK